MMIKQNMLFWERRRQNKLLAHTNGQQSEEQKE